MSLTIRKKRDNVLCPLFEDYIRSLPCVACQALGLVQVHRTQSSHMVPRGRAGSSSLLAVPQCQTHHPQSTRAARQVLERAGINIEELHRKLWLAFLRERKLFFGLNPYATFDKNQSDLEEFLLSEGIAHRKG